MKVQNDELNKNFKEINAQIDNALQDLSNKITKNLENTEKQIKTRIKEKKLFIMKLNNIKDIPNLQLRLAPQININCIINPVLFCLANLEIITEFILSEEKKEIFSKFVGISNFIVNFNYLMENIRNKNRVNPPFDLIHDFLKNYMNNYLTQDPAYIFNYMLSTLQNDIDVANVKENKFSNLIQNNFSMTLITKKKCNVCEHSEIVSRENKYIIDLFLRKPVIEEIREDLQSIFGSLLTNSNEIVNNEKCQKCGCETIRIKSLENLKKYLIININSDADPNNKMKIDYSTPLKFSIETQNHEHKKYEYELISALCDINTTNIDLNVINEMNKQSFKVFFKNFINDKWFKIININPEEFNGNIQAEISNYKPNILIYKKI